METILLLDDVWKNYWERPPLFKVIRSRVKSKEVANRFAVKNICLSVQKGECLGIIGRNGSGKSTLLKIIARYLKPSKGVVLGSQNIRALIELGVGLDQNQSGIENIRFFLQMQGHRGYSFQKKEEEIHEFSELGDAIFDKVKTYSSGMFVRLAYSMHALVNADILIVDEALAVGDARFQHKCFNHISALKNDGTAIILVSHSLEQVRQLCSRVVVMEHGSITYNGTVSEGCDQYLRTLFGRQQMQMDDDNRGSDVLVRKEGVNTQEAVSVLKINEHPLLFSLDSRYGAETGTIYTVGIDADGATVEGEIHEGFTELAITIGGATNYQLDTLVFGFSIKSKEGSIIYGTNNFIDRVHMQFRTSNGSFLVRMAVAVPLRAGTYFADIGVCVNDDTTGGSPLDVIPSALTLHVTSSRSYINDGFLQVPVIYQAL